MAPQETLLDLSTRLSITVGYLGADVHERELDFLHKLPVEKCEAGMVALEKGEKENHLHFQTICIAMCKSPGSFGLVVGQYMGWGNVRTMNPIDKRAITYVRGRYYEEEPEKSFAGQEIDEEEVEEGDGEKHLANSLKDQTKVEEATGQDHGDMLKFS
ncbi:unnamed protein product [Calypogeia fissa]